MTDILPLFSTSASRVQGGIWTIEKAGAAAKTGRTHGPISLCDIAKRDKLTQLHLVQTNCIDLMMAAKNLAEVGCALVYGLKIVVCDDMTIKDEASFRNESKVIIWMAGDGLADYEALIALYTKAAQDGFYYVPRLDWKTLKAMWHPDLMLSLPFYSSFLARNTLTFASIVPDLPVKPNVLVEVDQRLAFDDLILDAVNRYIEESGAEVEQVKTCYYERRAQAKDYLCYLCALDRKTYDKPGRDWFWSKQFCLEAHKELAGQQEAAA